MKRHPLKQVPIWIPWVALMLVVNFLVMSPDPLSRDSLFILIGKSLVFLLLTLGVYLLMNRLTRPPE